MKKIIISSLFLVTLMFANNLNSLLNEYENVSKSSLRTVDEKLGHVLIYSQKDIKSMQYHKLSDILKELPLLNLNKNRFGLTTPSLAGTKTTVSGFFRLFINNHEVSSIHSQSFAISWGQMPLDFVDHVEIYYGESSFALGNETGIYFIRVYTKSPEKENSTEFKSILSSNNTYSQSMTHSQSLENGWSYLFFLNKNKAKDSTKYNNIKIPNNSDKDYLYLDIINDSTKINIAYSRVKKDGYMGLSTDILPEVSDSETKDYFIDFSKYLQDDKSLKVGVSFNKYTREYEEENKEGIILVPEYNYPNTITEFSEDIELTKVDAFISKEFQLNNNKILSAIHVKNKKYKLNSRSYREKAFGSNVLTETNNKSFNNFNEETIYSLLLQDELKINEDLLFITNAKLDKYKRNDYLEDSIEKLYRVGAIYTPFESFGLKAFYTKTYLPPSFYNVDFASSLNKNIKTQKYTIFTTEGVYITENSKSGITYHNVKIDDFVYSLSNRFVPGFINIDHQIKTSGVIFDYEYLFSNNEKIKLNYFVTKSSEDINNSDSGGYIKYMSSLNKFDYFSSLIFRNKYTYNPTGSNSVSVKDSFNLSLGVTYNYTKDLSFAIKGENLLDKSTKSLYFDGTNNIALKDFDRSFSLSMRWAF